MIRINNFTKVNSLILMLLIPVLIMYTLSNRTSISVLQQNIREARMDKLSYLFKQLDANVRQISMMANVLLKDPNVKQFRDMDLYGDDFNIYKTEQIISEKLNLQSVANTFSNKIVIYAPRLQKAIGQYSLIHYDANELQQHASPNWEYVPEQKEFVLYVFSPIRETNFVDNATLIAKVSFGADNVVKMLDNYHSEGSGETFLYNPITGMVIEPGSANLPAQRITDQIRHWPLNEQGYDTIQIDNSAYLVNYAKSDELGWYLVDYAPLQQILAPITASRQQFYIFLGIMLFVSIMISYILYQNIRRPIKKLILGVQQLKKGNYSAQIDIKSENEFTFLFKRFNEMAVETGNLIEKVYMEQIRSREATLKQLQSQINPHFLYNCLAFMKSMAVLEEKESIIAMSVSLSKYYRYMTRNEKQSTTVREELELVANYLRIQSLQMKRLQFRIEVPDAILDLAIPRLLIQPVVENAIIHGVEPYMDAGTIVIRGERCNGENRIVIEDDGPGLDSDERFALSKKINMPLTDEIGCGLWNVHQRLRYQFDAASGLSFDRSSPRGLKVILHWS